MAEKKVIKMESQFGRDNLIVEAGKLALLADGSVTMQYGDTKVLATVVVSDKPRENAGFFPMSVDFEEKWYATGKISGSRFVKREGRTSELGILRARLIDRPIRPLFPNGYYNDVQIIIIVLSADEINDPGILGINAASAALSISGAPFDGPVGAARIGLIDGKFITNPTTEERETSELDLIIAGTKEAILMVESGAKEISEAKMLEALDYGHKAIQSSIELQEKLKKEVSKKGKDFSLVLSDEEVFQAIDKYLANKLGAAIRHTDKYTRQGAIDALENEVIEELSDKYEEELISQAFEKVIKGELRRAILEEEIRPDGRKLNEIRPVSCELDLSPRAHGSGLFTRGQTQILSIATLGSPGKAQTVESMDQDFNKKFMHYYNFPPFSVGETKPLRGPSRRDIGHGALVERSIKQVLPDETDFPYVIRVVSETLGCNGSSSMGSVCGTSLALMAAGVPIKPVSGIAMGLISKNGDIREGYKILSDIQGAEDFAGDMDFKIAGTKKGITALQMDIKVTGLNLKILEETMAQAKEGRDHIMQKMLEVIPESRADLSKYAPRLTTLKIDPDKIRVVIGKGGEMINKIIDETGVEIDIEDDGTVIIASVNAEDAKKAISWIEALTEEPKVGKTYEAKVVKIMEFGAFVEFMPGREGLVHISKLADHRVENVADEVKEGEIIKVKLMEVDSMGRNNLSRKDAS